MVWCSVKGMMIAGFGLLRQEVLQGPFADAQRAQQHSQQSEELAHHIWCVNNWKSTRHKRTVRAFCCKYEHGPKAPDSRSTPHSRKERQSLQTRKREWNRTSHKVWESRKTLIKVMLTGKHKTQQYTTHSRNPKHHQKEAHGCRHKEGKRTI